MKGGLSVTQVRIQQSPGCCSSITYKNEDPVRQSRPILHDVRRGREQPLTRQWFIVVLCECTHIVCVWERQARRKAEEGRLLLTIDGRRDGDGAHTTRIDVAERVRERLDSTGPANHTNN